jgi:hypothetical protein
MNLERAGILDPLGHVIPEQTWARWPRASIPFQITPIVGAVTRKALYWRLGL